jgi:hypothetical protein
MSWKNENRKTCLTNMAELLREKSDKQIDEWLNKMINNERIINVSKTSKSTDGNVNKKPIKGTPHPLHQ